jgi:fructokinase
MNVDDPFEITGKPAIVGTGLISLDLVLSSNGSRSPRLYAGGTCGNLLIIMSYLGWKSYPVSRMNGDKASKLVAQDMLRWGVKTDCATAKPGSNTPVIVQRINRTRSGEISHRYSWKCPNCGAWLPSYSAVPAKAAQAIGELVKRPAVFFFDRVSRGAIDLGRHYAREGALVVFEPSGIGNPRLFQEALGCAHVVKYSEQRIAGIKGLHRVPSPLLEIQTRGSKGLRYRRLISESVRQKWTTFAALSATDVKDTSGAGDWCCAGIIHRLGSDGLLGFQKATECDIRNAIRFGQAMATWSCKFDGPRGGMYLSAKSAFRNAIRELLRGHDAPVSQHSTWKEKAPRLKCLSASCRKRLMSDSMIAKAA